MRICVVYDCLYPYTIGGGERWYRNLAERLAAEGHDVTYLTLRQWERGERVEIDQRVRVIAVGPRMRLYTKGGRRRILPPLVFGLGVLAHLLARGRRYDVVHTCAFPYFSLLAAAAVRRVRPFVLEVDWFEVWSRHYWLDYLGGPGGRVGALVQRLCAHVPQRAFCFSELHAARLREEGLRGPVTVLRGLYSPHDGELASSTAAATPRERAEQPTVLFAGRMIAEKQAPLGVAAIALASERIPGLRGEFLGDGPERSAVQRAIAEHGLQDRVSSPGFAEAGVVEHEMREAMCVLLPSRREGYGMVVVEAAAKGTPSVVVAGEDNAATELIEEGVNGAVAERSDPAAIAEAIVHVHAAGSALRERTSAWYADNAERLSLESSLRTVLAGYAPASSTGTGVSSPATPDAQSPPRDARGSNARA
ncbi:MAG: glycosyl transferase group 1 [Solirubrobacterales bacterium]|jgi:glycosyltransferase involved in cell wall biosynthesis|nr:glycosyl transferase group 1 [Solirubrobacterales bacterium]